MRLHVYHDSLVVGPEVPSPSLFVHIVSPILEDYPFLQPFLEGDSVTETELVHQLESGLVADTQVEVVQSAVHLRYSM